MAIIGTILLRTHPPAPVGYLMFAPSSGGWLVTAIGDRRFAVVGGTPVPFHVLKDGDTVELGGLTVMYRV